jgi:hypothetical protein
MTTNSDSPSKPSRRRKRNPHASSSGAEGTVAPAEVREEAVAASTEAPAVKMKPVRQAEVATPPPPVAPPAPRPVDVKPRVRLRVWVTACGRRMEHMAGFVRMMQGQRPEKRTMAEWTAAYEQYMNTPA